MKLVKPWLPVLVAAALAASGCGYTLVGRGSFLPEDIRTIYVAPLENRTLQGQVEQILTTAITGEFVKRRRFEVVNDRGDADAEMLGAVTGFGATPVAFDQDGRATRFEISITAAMVFRRTDEAKTVLWASDRYLFRRQYELELSSTDFFDPQNVAVEEVAEEFAETLVIDVLEGF